ncbi:MFS transporter [Frankia sp. CNm7]|uniref:MFS transporter n=1 Tax=Frankia nepalensis TaxID=1836974 RepID=A0A937RHM0_9ACTN|nr:MFS transporter [Frankia nepalensis]MBL7500592.1 MFS transporter [Frankia nepalensis]MBL7511007.1 MFS transporter [Frankia nepalensis]MBL7520819.1 MFS transporter [Frankia nepalensis]MBL7630312.1 MFS transporter [Frankia nepalensis]
MSAEPGSGAGRAASPGPGAAGNRPAAARTPGRGSPTLIFVTLALGASAYTVLQSLVLPALPVIQRDLHTSQATSSWLLTAFLLSASIATPILGRVGDLVGKRQMLLVVFAALSVGSLISGLADSIGVLILARVIQGLAGAIFPLSYGIIRDEFPAARVPAAIGLMSGMLGIGSGLGVVLAGPIVDALSWHWLFWFPLMVSGLALVATFVFIPDSPARATGSVNLPAAGALAAWLVALLLGLSKGSTWGWASGGTIGLFAAAVVLFGVWVLVESRSAVPLIDLQVMRIPAVWWTNIAALLLGIGMYASFIVVPPLMQTPTSVGYGLGASVTLSGLYMLPGTAAMLVVGVLIGRITDRFGAKLPLVVGSVIAAAACALLVAVHNEPWSFIVMSAVQGIGIGLAFSSMANLIIQSVPVEATGAATGMNANIRTIGGSIGSGIIASVLAAGTLPSGYPKESGYVIGMVVLGAATLVAALAGALVPTARARAGRAGGMGAPTPVVAAGEAVSAPAAS